MSQKKRLTQKSGSLPRFAHKTPKNRLKAGLFPQPGVLTALKTRFVSRRKIAALREAPRTGQAWPH
jgi:hypothetical protein